MNDIKVAIVDDHQLFRRSLTHFVNDNKGMHVAIEAANGQQLLDQLEKTRVDVVLLDIEMPVMNGYETSKHLSEKYPEIKILIISQLTSRESIHRMMDVGAQGYFTKNSNPEQLEHAIRHVHEEGFYFGVELASVIMEAFTWQKREPTNTEVEIIDEVIDSDKDHLTEREIEIIKMSCKEYNSKQIAEKLFINVRTVETHRNRIMTKCKSKNIVGVILFALKNKLIKIEDI